MASSLPPNVDWTPTSRARRYRTSNLFTHRVTPGLDQRKVIDNALIRGVVRWCYLPFPQLVGRS
jgi:hypothetical protein